MKSSFADADQTTVPPVPTTTPEAAAPIPTSAALAVPEQKSTAVVPDSYFQNDQMEGDYDKSDIKLPRLALAQAVGDLSNELGFAPGNFVYDKQQDLGNSGVELTIVHMRKYFLEALPFESEEIPMYFKTLEDARRAGFHPIQEKKQHGDDARYVKPVLDVDVLIKGKPEYSAFTLDCHGTPYAKARWTLQSTAYSRVGKQFITDSGLALRAGFTTKFYRLSAKKEKLGENWVWVPRVQLAGANTPEFIAWEKLLSGK